MWTGCWVSALKQTVLGDLYGPGEDDKSERYTPWPLFKKLDEEFIFTLDACATPLSAKCGRYFTKADDGLKQPWDGERVFCNPPYDNIEAWVEKAWREANPLTVMLVPAWTDRKWWQNHVEPFRDDTSKLKTRFLPGRIRFGSPSDITGENAGSPSFWCCLLIFRRG